MSKSNYLTISFVILSALFLVACQENVAEDTSDAAQANEANMVQSDSQDTMQQETLAEQKTLSTTTSYQSPAGEEQVGFSLTVDQNGVITDAETEVLGKAPTSVMRQESFAEEFPSVLVGKKLSELESVDRIGGSSLTTEAFNEAIDDLRAQI